MKANQLSDVQLPVKIISFNTGREYSSCGQRIAAVKLSTGNIAFVDHDRGLDGVTPPVDALIDEKKYPEFVMRHYDNGTAAPLDCLSGSMGNPDNYYAMRSALRAAAESAPKIELSVQVDDAEANGPSI